MHRTLTSLIEKGMVRPSLDSPTLYLAVDLDPALEAPLNKHQSELRELERQKQELQELAKREQFGPVEEVPTFKIVKNAKELYAVTLSSVGSITEELVFVVPTRLLPMFFSRD